MEEIVIGLVLDYDEPHVVNWNHLDAILARPQFSKLRKFRVCAAMSAWLVDHLPQSYPRNILSVESLRWEFAIL
jgi:hypothetical protein